MKTRSQNRPYPVYFIGAGPGDVRYLTLGGARALAECSLVYAVDPYPDTFGELLAGKTVHDPFDRCFDDLVNEIEAVCLSSSVGFLVPGDMTVFSPFLPIAEHFSENSRVIAGVGAMNAAAALLRHTLDMPGISHSVVLTSPKHLDRLDDADGLKRLAKVAGTLVLYMNNRPLQQLARELSAGFDPGTPVAIASRVGMAGEQVYRCTLATMAEAVGEDDIFGLVSGDPSLAIIIVGEVLEARSDPGFWDKRKEKFWNKSRKK